MSLSLQEINNIANLARLELTDAEKKRYREQLSAILEHVAQLQKLNTTAMRSELTTGVFSAETSLRVDEPRPGLTPDALLKTAASSERMQFKIPPVFE
jgi:aspartyl-tRNA(Asn)/glutamyl-tRNA(Gln) amidotransferase subunit C